MCEGVEQVLFFLYYYFPFPPSYCFSCLLFCFNFFSSVEFCSYRRGT